MALFLKLKIILLALFIAFQNEGAVSVSESKCSSENNLGPRKEPTGIFKSRSENKPARVYRISASETPSLTHSLMSTAGAFEPFSTSKHDLKNTQLMSKIKGEVNATPRSGNLNTKKLSIMKYSSNDDETPSTTNEHYEWTSSSGSLNPELTTVPEIPSSAWSNFDSIQNKAMARINDKTGSINFWLTNLPEDRLVTSTQQNTNDFQKGNFNLFSNGDGKYKFSSWSTIFPEHEANSHPDADELSASPNPSQWTTYNPKTSWSEAGMNGQHRQDRGKDHHAKIYNYKQHFNDQEYEDEEMDDQQRRPGMKRRHGMKRRNGHKMRRGKTSSPSSEYPGLFTLNRLTSMLG